MKIGLVQYSPDWEDKQSNQSKLLKLIDTIDEEISLFIFPELTLTGFTMQSNKYAETLDGSSFNFFKNISQKHKVHVIAGIIENDEDQYYNTIIHINPDGNLQSRYRKIHPFSFGKENQHYQKGIAPVITKIDDLTFGLTICYDLRFPELYRLYGKQRVDGIINIANWPEPRINHWCSLLKARAIENQCYIKCYIIGVNRVGKDRGNQYTGYSSVFHPFGDEIIVQKNDERIITANLLKSEVDRIRADYPFLDDIRLI